MMEINLDDLQRMLTASAAKVHVLTEKDL